MRLVLVPTPIGNLEDITLRALRVLKEVEVVACEDTRRTGLLLKHYGIPTPTLRLDQHTVGRARELLAPYRYVAYATDAGTPGISDPGAELVRLALEWGWRVEALPGPTALIPALVASGLPTHRFTFEGFLPKGKGAEGADPGLGPGGEDGCALREPPPPAQDLGGSPRGLRAGSPRGGGPGAQQAPRGDLSWKPPGSLGTFPGAPGEFVLVLGPKALEAPNGEALARRLKEEGLSGRALVRALVALGLPRNEAYRLALEEEEG